MTKSRKADKAQQEPLPALPPFTIEEVSVTALRPHPRNYREHPEDQLNHIVQSIRENGIYRNVIIARDNTILAGHGVVLAAAKMGMATIPVRRLDVNPEDPRALKVLVGDNEMSHLGVRKDREATELLKSIKEQDPAGLLGTGFDDLMLAGLLMVTRPANEIRDVDEAAHWVGMPSYDLDDGGKAPKFNVVINFASEEDREAFFTMLGHKVCRTMWWPLRENEDTVTMRWDDKGEEAGAKTKSGK